MRPFWGNEKWGWGPTETEHSRAKICNACNFRINIFSCSFDVQRFTRQRDKNLLVRNKTINSNNRRIRDHLLHVARTARQFLLNVVIHAILTPISTSATSLNAQTFALLFGAGIIAAGQLMACLSVLCICNHLVTSGIFFLLSVYFLRKRCSILCRYFVKQTLD